MAKRKKRITSKKRRGSKKKQNFWTRLTNLFKPQKSNKYRSQLLHPESLMMLSIILVAIFALVNAVRFFPSIADKVLGFASNINVQDVLQDTNQERSKLGLEPLVLNEELNQAALAKAQDMFNEQYWSHVSPDGKEPWDFIKGAGYVYKYAGENLARDFDNSEEMVVAWMNSPTHRENIVNPNFTQMGLAVVNGKLKGFNTTLVVQMFASPGSVKMKTLGDGTEFHLPKAAEEVEKTKLSEEIDLVAGETNINTEIVISPLHLTKTFFLIIIALIVMTLSYDAFVSNNRRYQRIVGQNFAHIMLFVSVAFLLILFKGGNIAP